MQRFQFTPGYILKDSPCKRVRKHLVLYLCLNWEWYKNWIWFWPWIDCLWQPLYEETRGAGTSRSWCSVWCCDGDGIFGICHSSKQNLKPLNSLWIWKEIITRFWDNFFQFFVFFCSIICRICRDVISIQSNRLNKIILNTFLLTCRTLDIPTNFWSDIYTFIRKLFQLLMIIYRKIQELTIVAHVDIIIHRGWRQAQKNCFIYLNVDI